jgi:hypothetical protein
MALSITPDTDAGVSISDIAARAETTVRVVRDAIDANRLKVQSRGPTRVKADSAAKFIADARGAKLKEMRMLAGDLMDQGYERPFQISERFSLDEGQILTAIQRGRLPAVGRGLWLFIGPADAERFAAAHQTGRAAA